MMTSNRNASYMALQHRATFAAQKASTMMLEGSREYQDLRNLVNQYCDFNYAADIVSGQTDTGLGDLDVLPAASNTVALLIADAHEIYSAVMPTDIAFKARHS